MSISLIQLLNEANKANYVSFRKSNGFESKEVLAYYEKELRDKFSTASNSRWEVALTIANLVRSGSWTAFSSETRELYTKWLNSHGLETNPYRPLGFGVWNVTNSIYLLTFLKEKFGLGRTTVYNYLEVVDEFATYIEEKGKEPYYSINEEAKHYQFWQLVEMTSLTYSERLKVQSNWTREEIRAYKKTLREKIKKQIQPAERVEAEEKPQSEAQQRFAKYSKDDLINYVVELEEERLKYKTDYDTLFEKVRPYEKDKSLAVKRDLQKRISDLLKAYDYQIILNGRKQGVISFSGVLAKSILGIYSSESDSSSVPPTEENYVQEELAV